MSTPRRHASILSAAPTDRERRALVAEARAGFPAHKGGAKNVRARAALARALWNNRGERKLPGTGALDSALSGLSAADLAWMCELSPLGPLYLLPTRRFVRRLAETIVQLGVTRVLEVAAGDGFLARSLARAAPTLEVTASDSGAWVEPHARMSASERRALAKVAVPGLRLGVDVKPLEASQAIASCTPELVLCSWLPPGHRLLDTLIRAPVRYVLELGAGSGVTASAYSWRFAHEFLEGPLEQSARCRLDARPHKALHSRVTLYFGSTHEEHHEEVVRPGDWLHQFKPRRVLSG
jgi:protein-L-isoaspartate O-methyltransferase